MLNLLSRSRNASCLNRLTTPKFTINVILKLLPKLQIFHRLNQHTLVSLSVHVSLVSSTFDGHDELTQQKPQYIKFESPSYVNSALTSYQSCCISYIFHQSNQHTLVSLPVHLSPVGTTLEGHAELTKQKPPYIKFQFPSYANSALTSH